MTGTGTQADPYMPENWDEIVETVGKTDKYVKCVPNLTINWNDVDPTGKLYGIAFRCTEFDGNGIVISGILCDLDSSSNVIFDVYKVKTVKNINFINFQINSGFLFSGTSGSTKIYNIIAIGSVTSTYGRFSGDNNKFYYSYIKTDLYGRAYPAYKIYLYHSIFDINCISELENSSKICFWGTDFIIKGKYNYYIDCSNYIERAIIDIDAKSLYLSASAKSDLVVVNTDKIEISDPDLAIHATSSQLKDPEALKALGFPIRSV